MDPIEAVYRADHARLWRALLAYTGDADIASEAEAEVFSQAFGRKDELIDPEAWIWRSAFRIAAGLMHRRRRDGSAAGDLERPGFDQPLIEFLDMLGGLSEQQRAVVVLRYAGRFSPTDIANLLNTTPETVRVQLHRAHTELRERIDLP